MLAAQVRRKTVRAPFRGRAGVRAVSVGDYLNAGTVVTTLETLGPQFVDFAVPQEQVARLRIGTPVRYGIRGGTSVNGSVIAIDAEVDEATRSLKMRANALDDRSLLKPGMFVDVAVRTEEHIKVVAVPTTAIVHAPYGDSVF